MRFVLVTKQMQSFLQKFIEYVNTMAKKFEENNTKLASLNKFLYEYEELSVQTYSPKINQYLGSASNLPSKKQLPEEQLLFENSKNANLKEDLDNLPLKIINPFIQLRQWLKYELLDIEALQEAIERSSDLVKRKQSRISKNKDDEKELFKLKHQKTTVTSIFMTLDQIEKRKVDLARNIENAVEDLFNWEQLSVITQMVLNTNTIPFFKMQKFHMYYLAVNQFTQY